MFCEHIRMYTSCIVSCRLNKSQNVVFFSFLLRIFFHNKNSYYTRNIKICLSIAIVMLNNISYCFSMRFPTANNHVQSRTYIIRLSPNILPYSQLNFRILTLFVSLLQPFPNLALALVHFPTFFNQKCNTTIFQQNVRLK